MTYIIIGAGSRGSIYGNWAHRHGHTIIAIADLRSDRLNALGDELEVPEDMRFGSAEAAIHAADRGGQNGDQSILFCKRFHNWEYCIECTK